MPRVQRRDWDSVTRRHAAEGPYTVGVLVQCNYGLRDQLRVAGVPVGRDITEGVPKEGDEHGSIIIVVGTDAPLLPPAQAAGAAGRARPGAHGSVAGNGSGDIFIAFSTANERGADPDCPVALSMLPNDRMNPLFTATVEATEEAIINAMVASGTMTGIDGHVVIGLPHEKLRDVLRKDNRLVERALPDPTLSGRQ